MLDIVGSGVGLATDECMRVGKAGEKHGLDTLAVQPTMQARDMAEPEHGVAAHVDV
jgi:hypothetical protein